MQRSKFSLLFSLGLDPQYITEHKDGTISYDGDIDLSGKNFKVFPVKFRKVKGSFSCSGCISITSLEGAPQEVGGDFYCNDCISLTTLAGAPQKVRSEFYLMEKDSGSKYPDVLASWSAIEKSSLEDLCELLLTGHPLFPKWLISNYMQELNKEKQP